MAATSSLRWLRGRVEMWLRRACLADTWDVEVKLVERLGGRKRSAAVTTWLDGYCTGTISFDVETFNKTDERETDALICHEIAHLFTAREDDALAETVGREGTVYKHWVKQNELFAEAFAKMLIKAYTRKP